MNRTSDLQDILSHMSLEMQLYLPTLGTDPVPELLFLECYLFAVFACIAFVKSTVLREPIHKYFYIQTLQEWRCIETVDHSGL
jgi:hypothetical protein